MIVKSPRGDARIISVLGPTAAIVGEVSMIDGRPRSATVIALQDSALQFLSREAFSHNSQPEATSRNLPITPMVTLAKRLREADETVAATTFLTVKGRVARALIELAKHVGQDYPTPDASRLSHKVGQGDLAAMAGVARENVSRTLREWKRRELVTQNLQAYYCVNDTAALAKEIQCET